MSENYFVVLSAVDVKGHIEKKGQFSYLSWPFAVAELKKRHPDATWEVLRFDGKPFLQTDNGYFVEVAVTVNGITHSQIHPVLDSRNKPILAPSPFDINTSIQRCLVKAIALHGLGLYIYAGEDLPIDGGEPKPIDEKLLSDLRAHAKLGTESLKKAWSGLSKTARASLEPELNGLKALAREWDEAQ